MKPPTLKGTGECSPLPLQKLPSLGVPRRPPPSDVDGRNVLLPPDDGRSIFSASGADDAAGDAGAFVVGCYFADWGMCRVQAQALNTLLTTDPDLRGAVRGAVLNYRLPMSCSMSTACPASDPRLTYGKWQKGIVEAAPDLTFFQDTPSVDAWDRLYGCGHDDLIVYDRSRTVAEYLPSNATRMSLGIADADWTEQDMNTTAGLRNVRLALLRVVRTDGTACSASASASESALVAGSVAAFAVSLLFIGSVFWVGHLAFVRLLGGGGTDGFLALDTEEGGARDPPASLVDDDGCGDYATDEGMELATR